MTWNSRDLEIFYHGFGQLLSSGLNAAQAAAALAKGRKSGKIRAGLRLIEKRLVEGATIRGAAAAAGFPELDLALLEAGEASGHTDKVMAYLSDYHASLRRLRGSIVRESAYPVFLLHFGVLLSGLPGLVASGDFAAYARTVLPVLGAAYLTGIILFFLCRFLGKVGSSVPWVDTVMRAIPLVGGVRRSFSVARFCKAYGMQLWAGIPAMRALPAAVAASGSGRLAGGVDRVVSVLAQGRQAGPELAALRLLPDEVALSLVLGEETGRLEQELKRWETEYSERAERGLHAIAVWTGRLLFLGVAVYLGYRIVDMYAGSLRQIQKLSDSIL